MSNLDQVKGNLIVSCQALPDEPLHSSFIMGRMALAALQGGAKGIIQSRILLKLKRMWICRLLELLKKYMETARFISHQL